MALPYYSSRRLFRISLQHSQIVVEEQDLEEYESRDRDYTNDELVPNFRKKKEKSILDFYPEYDWLRGTVHASDIPPRFDLLSREKPIPLQVPLAFHDAIVVGLEPVADERAFKAWYGVSIETFVGLMKDSRIAVRISSPLRSYEGLDFLDSVFEFKLPTPYRAEAFCRSLQDETDADALRKDAANQVGRMLGDASLRPLGIPRPKWELAEGMRTIYTRLVVLGYSRLLSEIERTSKPSEVASKMRLLYLTTAAGTFRSLGGFGLVPSREFLREATNVKEFPVDVGKFLIQELNLVRPDSLDQALKIYPDYHKARACLEALNDALMTKSQAGKVLDRAAELRAACKEVEEMEKNAKTLGNVTVGVAAVGGIAVSLAALGLPGVLLSTGIALSRNKIAEVSGDRLAKLGRPSCLAEFYELKKSAKKWRDKSY